jgi:hemolysin III
MILVPGQSSLKRRAYSRAELWVDGILHSVALLAALVGVMILMILVGLRRSGVELTTTIVYSVGLLAMLGFSLAYNMTPQSRLKLLLRRFDHSAIFLMIAGTYTPLITQLQDSTVAWMLGVTVWLGAIAGITLKLILPNRFDKLSIAVYLALGWVAVLAIGPLIDALPPTAMILLVVGGGLYTLGVVFHVWNSLKFQNAIWHLMVIAAAACHYAAIVRTMAV